MGTSIQAEAKHIAGLMIAIKKQCLNRLRNVQAHHLVIWHCKQLILLATKGSIAQTSPSVIDNCMYLPRGSIAGNLL